MAALRRSWEIMRECVMVSWMHNTAVDINDIGRGYNHREHRVTQRINLNDSVLSVSSVVKSGGFYRMCWIDSTTTDY